MDVQYCVVLTTSMQHDVLFRMTSGDDVNYIHRCFQTILVKNHQSCIQGVSNHVWHQVTEFLVINSVDQIVIMTLKNTLIVRCLEER